MAAHIDTVTVKGTQVPFIYEESKQLPIISLQVVFKGAGSIQDGDKPGLARIASMVMNEGTKKMGATAFAEALESKAIDLRITHGRETFVLSLDSLKEEFDAGVSLLENLLDDPNLTDESVGKVKTKLLGSLKRKETDYDYIASRNLYKAIFAKTPIADPTSGEEESIIKINTDDVKQFLKSYVNLDNAIVVIGGDLSEAKAKEIATAILKHLDKGTEHDVPFYHATPSKDLITKKPATEQAYVYFGAPFLAKTNDEDAFKAKVAAFILGSSGFGSRLMEEVRVKRGLAYSAYARINMAVSHSYFSGYLQTKLESQDEAVKVVRDVINEFIKKGATQKELDSAKKFLLGSEPLRTETLSQRLSRTFNEFYEGKKPGHSQDDLIRIEAMTLKELNQYILIHPEIANLTFSIVTK